MKIIVSYIADLKKNHSHLILFLLGTFFQPFPIDTV